MHSCSYQGKGKCGKLFLSQERLYKLIGVEILSHQYISVGENIDIHIGLVFRMLGLKDV